MTILRSFFTVILAATCLSAFGQSADSSVFLKWKLKPGEALTYKTVMDEIDTGNHKDAGMANMAKMMGMKDAGQVAEMNKAMKEMKEVVKGFGNYGLLTKLTKKRRNIIDIEMSTVDSNKNEAPLQFGRKGANDSLKNFAKMLSKMALSGVMLRGAVYEDGRIESFYLPNTQLNLVSLFFNCRADLLNLATPGRWIPT